MGHRIAVLRASLVCVAVVALLCGCKQSIDLSALQKLGAAMNDQETANAAIAADMYGSCQRQYTWRSTGQANPIIIHPHLTPANAKQLARAVALHDQAVKRLHQLISGHASRFEIKTAQKMVQKAAVNVESARGLIPKATPMPNLVPTSTPKPIPASTPAPSPTASSLLTPQDTNDPCQYEEDAAEQWESVNLVVTNYVRALANLAGGNDTNTSFGLDSLAKDATNAGIFKNGQGDAIKGFVKQLITDRSSFERRDDLAKDAPIAEAALGHLIDNLEYVARMDYRDELDGEQQTINNFFLDNFQATQAGLPALQSLQYRATWKSELDGLAQKRHAIDAYVQSLEKIRKVHHAILTQIQSSGFSNLTTIVSGYVSEYTPLVESIKKAYSSPAPAKSP